MIIIKNPLIDRFSCDVALKIEQKIVIRMDSVIPISRLLVCSCFFYLLSIPLSGQISKSNNSVIPRLKSLSAGNMKKFANKKKNRECRENRCQTR